MELSHTYVLFHKLRKSHMNSCFMNHSCSSLVSDKTCSDNKQLLEYIVIITSENSEIPPKSHDSRLKKITWPWRSAYDTDFVLLMRLERGASWDPHKVHKQSFLLSNLISALLHNAEKKNGNQTSRGADRVRKSFTYYCQKQSTQ